MMTATMMQRRFFIASLFCLCLIASNSYTFSYLTVSAARSVPAEKLTDNKYPEPKGWYPTHEALGNSYKEMEPEEHHPADKLLRKNKADISESYILGGY